MVPLIIIFNESTAFTEIGTPSIWLLFPMSASPSTILLQGYFTPYLFTLLPFQVWVLWPDTLLFLSHPQGCFQELLHAKHLAQYLAHNKQWMHFSSSCNTLEIVWRLLRSYGWNQLLSKHTQERHVEIQDTGMLRSDIPSEEIVSTVSYVPVLPLL